MLKYYLTSAPILLRRIVGVFLFLTSLWLSATAQQQISGKVTDDKGAPLIGANILLEGSTTGTVTDLDGQYSLSVPANGVLVFSYTGFTTQTVPIVNRTRIDIIMEADSKLLDEFVVTGLGPARKKDALGYATTTVSGTEIVESQRDNWFNSLAARIPGATISGTSGMAGSSTLINLRGVSSLFGSNQPLIVVDGSISDNTTFNQGALVSDRPNRDNDYTNRAADINPNDIESITVLKGPEAAAIYGANAGNGVIVITTKKGAAGRGKVSYDNAFRIEQVYRMPETQTVFGRGLAGITDLNTRRALGPAYGTEVQLYDNRDNFLNQGFSQRHNMVFEGGTKEVSYRWSNSYQDYQGVIPNNRLQNFSSRLAGSVKLSNKFRTETNFAYINSVNDKVFRGANGVLLGLLAWPANDDITDYQTASGARRRLLSNVQTAEADNPLFNAFKNKNQDQVNRFQGSINLIADPFRWLNLRGTFGTDRYTQDGITVEHPESNAGFNTNGQIETYTSISRLDNANVTAKASHRVGKFGASLLVGSQIVSSRYDVNSMRGQKMFDPEFYNINNTDPTTHRVKSSITRKHLFGAFANLELNFDEMIYLTATGRNDWTSTLPAENRSYFYPSLGLSFIVTKLLPQNDVLTYLKLRGSYAEVAKDAPPHRIGSILEPRLTTGGGYSYGFFGGNPGLKPEYVIAREVGFEARLFKDRVTLDASHFFRTSYDQITPPRTSYGTGFILSFINSGILSNWGYEAALGITPIRSKNINWTLNFNFTRIDSRADRLPLDLPEFYVSDSWLFSQVRNSMFKGGTLSTFGIEDYLRNSRGDILINPGTGLPEFNTNVFTPVGDRNPDFTLGIGNSLSIKNFSLNFLFDIRKGGDVFNGNELFLFQNGYSNRFLDRTQPYVFKGVLRDGRENTENPTPNTLAVVPQYQNGFFSSFSPADFIERDINWVRLRELTISYRIPANALSGNKFLRSASVFLTGNDLFIITNYSGADPSVNGNTAASPGANAAGFDYGTLANPRAVTMGVRLGL
jgi:TonB-linked SusC/RagA family outer membrane protein